MAQTSPSPNTYSSYLPRIAAVGKNIASFTAYTLSIIPALLALPVFVHPPRLSVVRELEAPVDRKGRPLGEVIHRKTEVDEGKGKFLMPNIDVCELIPKKKNPKILPFIPVHGYRSNKTGVRFLAQFAKFLCRRGVATAAFDNPGTGNSKGFLNTPKQTLRALESVYLDLRSRVTKDGKKTQYKLAPVIGGFSLGSLAATYFAAKSNEPTSGLYLETPIIDLEEYLAKEMGLGKFIAKSMMRIVKFKRDPEENKIYNLMELIPELDHVPILISYSPHDPVVKKEAIEKFVKALKEHRQNKRIKTPVEVIVRESDRHMGNFYKDPEDYMKRVVTFFRNNQRTFEPTLIERFKTAIGKFGTPEITKVIEKRGKREMDKKSAKERELANV